MDALKAQTRMWSYFQSRPELFQRSAPRFLALVREIEHSRVPRSDTVLNIGAGDGSFERLAKSLGWRIESVDPDQRIVSALVEAGVKATVAAAERLPYGDRSVSIVVASEVIEHLSDDQLNEAIAEISRVLTAGGLFVGTVPCNENLSDSVTLCPSCGHEFHRWGHHQSFTLERLRSLLEASFVVKKLTRTAFVQPTLKGVVRLALAKLGSAIAVPSIIWVAYKR